MSASDTAAEASASNLWVSDFVLQNNDTTNAIFVGGADVDDTVGFKIPAGGAVSMSAFIGSQTQRQLNLNDLWVVCASGLTADVRVLYVQESFS